MKYGFSLIMRGKAATREAFEGMAEKAEELGLDSLWASDHIVIPERVVSKYPGRASGEFPPNWLEGYWEPYTALGYVAALTKRVTIGTSVLILPMRNPIEAAHAIADLDQLAAGRMVFGVGVGWFKEEYDALDWPFRKRGARMDEGLEICKALWSQERPTFKGKFYNFENVYFGPKPVQKPHPPIWIGGSSPVAMQRTARVADGWHPNRPTPEFLEKAIPELREYIKAAGRKPSDVKICVKTLLKFQNGPPGEGQMPTEGTSEDIIAALKRYEELGVDHFTFDFDPETLDVALATMERFNYDVRPRL
jgi:probable F420-dependent oxidoreductase